MAQIIVRKLEDDVKDRLKARAEKHGRSLEAEVRAILEDAAKKRVSRSRPSKKEKGFGTLMHERFKKTGLAEEEAKLFQEGIDELNANWRMQIPTFDE